MGKKAIEEELLGHATALDNIKQDMHKTILVEMEAMMGVITKEGFYGTSAPKKYEEAYSNLKDVFKVEEKNLETAAENMRIAYRDNKDIDQG